jgi:hypothetical protein
VVTFVRTDGDKIDLSTIDTDTDAAAGNQAFGFMGAQAFSGVDSQPQASRNDPSPVTVHCRGRAREEARPEEMLGDATSVDLFTFR